MTGNYTVAKCNLGEVQFVTVLTSSLCNGGLHVLWGCLVLSHGTTRLYRAHICHIHCLLLCARDC